jgi:hypothetical protein
MNIAMVLAYAIVTTLVLGSWPKQGHGKVWAKSVIRQSHTHFWECKRVWRSEPTHSQEVTLWELDSQRTPKSLESGLRGQNSLDWIIPYTIGKLLRHRCLKCVHIIHLNTYNTSYGWKHTKTPKILITCIIFL